MCNSDGDVRKKTASLLCWFSSHRTREENRRSGVQQLGSTSRKRCTGADPVDEHAAGTV